MKRFISGMLALTLMLSGCAVKKEDVTITLPKEYFEMAGIDAATALSNNDAYKSMTTNEDGSVTLVFDADKYAKYLEEYKTQIRTSLDEIEKDTETFPNITKISVNDDFTQFDVTLENGQVGLMDSLSILMLYMYGFMYQVLLGEEAGSKDIIVNYLDPSGNIIDTLNSSNME